MVPPPTGECYEARECPSRAFGKRFPVSGFQFPVQTHRQVSELWCLVSCNSLSTDLAESNARRQELGCSYRDPIVWQKGNDQGDRDLSCHTRFPSRGNVRPGQPAETISRVRREQDCRRAGKIVEGRVPTFLGQARGSLIEMETQLVIAGNLGVLSSNTIAALIGLSGEVSRLPHGLMKSLQPAEPMARTRNQKLETAPGAKLCHLYG